MLWIAFTCFAAFCQSFRNALQSQLSGTLTTTGVTLARFLYASPLAAIYLIGLYQWQPAPWPSPGPVFVGFVVAASLTQIVATAFMVLLFKQKNYAIGAGLAKCEAPASAVLGVLFFGTLLSTIGWIGVVLGTVAIILLSMPDGEKRLSWSTLALGLACSTAFALTSLWVREASLSLQLPFPHSAAWVLACVITLQTLCLLGYITLKEPHTLTHLRTHQGKVVLTSLASFLGSLGWFSAVALQAVPYVKTLGQIEIFFMMLISSLWLKQKNSKKNVIALGLIGVAAVMVIWS